MSGRPVQRIRKTSGANQTLGTRLGGLLSTQSGHSGFVLGTALHAPQRTLGGAGSNAGPCRKTDLRELHAARPDLKAFLKAFRLIPILPAFATARGPHAALRWRDPWYRRAYSSQLSIRRHSRWGRADRASEQTRDRLGREPRAPPPAPVAASGRKSRFLPGARCASPAGSGS